MDRTAQQMIAALELEPHPEGGWYRQTWAAASGGTRPAGTAIYYLLAASEVSHWHRIDSAEVWHFYTGAALELSIAPTDDASAVPHILGPDVGAGARPQIVVPPHHWQSARTTGAWSLVGCTVSPGFQFDQFELAASGWSPSA